MGLADISGHTSHPYAWFDHDIIDVYATQVGPLSLSVYMALARLADPHTQTCSPSYDQLQALLRLSRKALADAIARLRHAGLITVSQRRSSSNGRATNMYTLMRHSSGPPPQTLSVQEINYSDLSVSLEQTPDSSPSIPIVSSQQELSQSHDHPQNKHARLSQQAKSKAFVESILARAPELRATTEAFRAAPSRAKAQPSPTIGGQEHSSQVHR